MSNKSILQRNSKMTKTMKMHAGYRIFNVSMPAGITCPMAGACEIGRASCRERV